MASRAVYRVVGRVRREDADAGVAALRRSFTDRLRASSLDAHVQFRLEVSQLRLSGTCRDLLI